jgi:hypothetical protein
MTATAALIERAGRWHAPGRRLLQGCYFANGIVPPLGHELYVHHVSRSRAWHKHHQPIERAHPVAAIG